MFTQPATGYVGYTIARIIDTGVGVAVSLLISLLHRSQKDKEQGISIKEAYHDWHAAAEGHAPRHVREQK